MGKRRTLDASRFEKWARAIVRSTGGDPDAIGDRVGRKLHWLVYDKKPVWQREVEFCMKRGRAMAWRHKVIIAELILVGEAEPPSSTIMALKLGPIAGPVFASQVKLYQEVLRVRYEKKN